MIARLAIKDPLKDYVFMISGAQRARRGEPSANYLCGQVRLIERMRVDRAAWRVATSPCSCMAAIANPRSFAGVTSGMPKLQSIHVLVDSETP